MPHIDGLKRISHEEGLKSLWSGMGPSLFLAGNPAIQFAVYEAIKRFLKKNGQKVGNVSGSFCFKTLDLYGPVCISRIPHTNELTHKVVVQV